MSIIQNLNNLEISIINAKQTLVNNINNKGGNASADDTLTEIADKVLDIPTTGGNGDCPAALDFSSIGYDVALSNEINSQYNADIAYSKTLYDAWNPSNTSADALYKNDIQLVYAPNIDTSNVTNMNNMFYGCSNLTSVPQFDTSKVTNMNQIFYGCSNLTLFPQQFDTSNVNDMGSMFYGCRNLTSVPLFNTTNVEIMRSMFQDCSLLTSVPQFDTSKVTNMYQMFYGCSGLTSVPLFNTSNVKNMGSIFQNCSSLTSIPLLDFGKVTIISSFFGYSGNLNALTDVGGFKDLNINWNDNYGLYQCPNLTYESVMNIINNLYDFRGNGDDTTTRTLKLNANSLALLSDDDKAVATAKGWILS